MDHFGNLSDINSKPDHSPVTDADREAELLILRDLESFYPSIPVIAEEAVSTGQIPDFERCFFLVDPLDGTREFIAGRNEFTVNIALIEDGTATFGIIYAPALEQLYVTLAPDKSGRMDLMPGSQGGNIANCSQIRARQVLQGELDVLVSYSHSDRRTESYLKDFPIRNRVSAGSSLKFCLLANGTADLYPRFGRTMEWDTAAGHAILQAAGGTVLQLDDSPLLYGKKNKNFANPAFIARGVRPTL